MNLKSLFFGLVCFALGIGAGIFKWRPAQAPTPSYKEKFQALADSDLEDYYRLKTMEEKYLKADEILGKIMVIFLADLGLRVSASTQVAAKQPAPLTTQARESTPELTNLSIAPPAPPKPVKGHFQRWNSHESSLVNVRDERSIPSLLRRLKIDDFDSALKSSTSFSNANGVLTSLNGAFEGRTQVKLGDASHAWYIHLELAGSMQKGRLTGDLKIRMLENGKVFSNSSGKGDIDSFRDFTGDSQALLIQASPKVYFQLYYLKELDQLAGNIYRRESDQAGFELIGSVSLKRAQ